MAKQSGKSKKHRQSANHKAKRAAATLRRNARANARKVRREKQRAYFIANPSEGSPSQLRRRQRKGMVMVGANTETPRLVPLLSLTTKHRKKALTA